MHELFLAELEREAASNRRTLERVPEGRNDWKPHEKSMRLGYLAALVASLPSWVSMTIKQDEFNLESNGNSKYQNRERATRQELLQLFDDSVAEAREALSHTSDEHLLKSWKFLVNGNLVSEQPRHIVLRDSVFNHLAHHRGQLTVYLRLTGGAVPAIMVRRQTRGSFTEPGGVIFFTIRVDGVRRASQARAWGRS